MKIKAMLETEAEVFLLPYILVLRTKELDITHICFVLFMSVVSTENSHILEQ
jgi:hypothetical protein